MSTASKVIARTDTYTDTHTDTTKTLPLDLPLTREVKKSCIVNLQVAEKITEQKEKDPWEGFTIFLKLNQPIHRISHMKRTSSWMHRCVHKLRISQTATWILSCENFCFNRKDKYYALSSLLSRHEENWLELNEKYSKYSITCYTI